MGVERTLMSRITVAIIGGGIAGTSCIEALIQDFDENNPQFDRIVLISEDTLVKLISNYERTGRQIEKFDVVEEQIEKLSSRIPNRLKLETITGHVKYVDYIAKKVVYSTKGSSSHKELIFQYLCICIGSTPRQFDFTSKDDLKVLERVLVLKDINSITEFKSKLSHCRRLVIVGDGGIGLELVHSISNCELIWIVKDDYVGHSFFDAGAAKFLLDAIAHDDGEVTNKKSSKIVYSSTDLRFNNLVSKYGASLGPNWSQNLEFSGKRLTSKLKIISKDVITNIAHNETENYPLQVSTRGMRNICCDLVLVAIGVQPNKLAIIGGCLETSESGGILVDNKMRTSLNQVYAAGDIVSCDKWNSNDLWFQKRLWSQARQMGIFAAKCIIADITQTDPSIFSNFDCFTHCTSFFGFKLILLGDYNGQIAERTMQNYEVIVRIDPSKEYVKILIKDDGRIMGAVIFGDGGLEETIENLIHDQIDVSGFKEQLLDNTVDIEDYFD